MTAILPRSSYAAIAAAAISIGIVVTSFASFGFLRATVFSQSATEEVKPPGSLYQRSQQQPKTFEVATPQPTIEISPEIEEFPVIEATEGGDATNDLDALWANEITGICQEIPRCQVVPLVLKIQQQDSGQVAAQMSVLLTFGRKVGTTPHQGCGGANESTDRIHSCRGSSAA